MQKHALNYKVDISTSSQKPNCDDPLSVAYFTPGWPPEASSNGIVTYVASMVEGIRKLGNKAYVLTSRLHDLKDLEPCNQDVFELSYRPAEGIANRLFESIVTRMQPGMPSRASFARAVRTSVDTLMHGYGLDLLEMEESFGLADFLRDRISIPVVVRLHGPWFLNGKATGATQDRNFLRRVQLEGQTISKAFAVTAPSYDVLEQTRQYYNLPLEKAVVIPCPIACTPKEQRWQIQNCEPDVIAFIGRFDRHKGGDLVIDAFAQVLRELPATRLIFAGPDRGYVDDNGRVWHLEEYVRERIPGALETGKIEWLGQQPPQMLRELRRRAQLTVIASRYDNFPYTALEALSLGCPIVGACAGGIPEIVTDGVSGLLFESGNAKDLATQIIHLLKNPNVSAELGYQAGEKCAERFSPEAVAKQSIDFYQETLELWSQSKTGLLATVRGS